MNTILFLPSLFMIVMLFGSGSSQDQETAQGYILERDSEVQHEEPGPHDGSGTTTAFRFFEKASPAFELAFRKRTLHPGASIGYHLQKDDEVYYVLSGTGEMAMNGKTFQVGAGDAILTRPGSSHGLKQTGKDDLTILIVYRLINGN
ncbi:MAG TPA: cupin domain-containing protein [Bacteroidota bacterium]